MKLFKWKISDLKPKFPNIVEKFLGKNFNSGTEENIDVSTVPSVNIANIEKAFEVSITVPGIDRKDIKIEVQNDCLIISSEKQYDYEENKKDWMRREYGYASFQRMFQLPVDADQNQIFAELKNGILSIKVGKKSQYIDTKKQIKIQ